MTQSPILTSRNIGETENALRAILIRVLAGTGLDYTRWVALQFVSLSQSPVPVDAVIAQLERGLKIAEPAARNTIADLQSRQILTVADDKASATEAGAALYQRLRDRISQVTQRLYADLSVEDLTAARRVLATVLERANAILDNWSEAA